MSRSFESQRGQWQRIPVDDVGYVDAAKLLEFSDEVLRDVVTATEHVRYTGWRNHLNGWRTEMGLDSVTGKRVLDYGCGLGTEALQYARGGNKVSLADINQASLGLASRVLGLHGFSPASCYGIGQNPPFISAGEDAFDLVVMNGVLHHIEDPVPVVRSSAGWLSAGGELRLMVYSDRSWRLATGTEPPPDVTSHPARLSFVRCFDQVGDWADWYDQARLQQRFGEWFTVERFTYITEINGYATAVLRKKP